MEIKASDVKQLRETTGAGMLDCKDALKEAEGDFKQAEKILKEKGIAAAAKRSGRTSNEGRIFIHVNDDRAGILELSSETDFVARNEDFITFGEEITAAVVNVNMFQVTPEIDHRVKELISTLKENITIKRFETIEIGKDELVMDYIHGEGRIGVLVKIQSEDPFKLQDENVKSFAFDLALHVAAFNPYYLSKDTVEKEYLAEQEAIFRKQAEQLGKPEKVLDGIVTGKLNKHLSEICLLSQGFVKEEKKSVEKYMNEVATNAGTKLSVTDYKYYRVGEDSSS